MATTGHVPQRRCRVCRTVAPKAKLHRWVLASGSLVPDPTALTPGRGYYSCRSERCQEILPRTLKKK